MSKKTLEEIDKIKTVFAMAPVCEHWLHKELQTVMESNLMGLIIFLFSLPGGQHGHVQPFSDEDVSIETLSHCSSFSDITSVADEGIYFYFFLFPLYT